MDQMEAFTEIMLRRFYLVCPGVLALVLGRAISRSQEKCFWGLHKMA